MPARSGFGLTLVVLATIALAFKGVVARFAYAEGLTVDMLLVLRFTLAMPLFLYFGWLFREPGSTALSPAQWRACAFSGALFFLAAWFDFNAVAMVGAALSRIVLFTFPAFVLLLQWFFDGRRPQGRELLGFGLGYAGLGLVLLPSFAPGAPVALIGLLYALGSAVTYAWFWYRSQNLTRALGSARFNAVANLFTFAAAALVLMPMLGPEDFHVTPAAFGWVLIITLFCTVLPFLLLFEGIRRAGAAEAGLVTLFGPAVTVVAAWALLGETLDAVQLAGFAVITLGMAALKRPSARAQAGGSVTRNDGRSTKPSRQVASPGSAPVQSSSDSRKSR